MFPPDQEKVRHVLGAPQGLEMHRPQIGTEMVNSSLNHIIHWRDPENDPGEKSVPWVNCS